MTARPRGFALVTVLWVGLLLGLFVAGILEAVEQGRTEVLTARDRLAAEALSETGLARAIWILKTGGPGEAGAAPLRPDGLVWRDNLAEGRIAVRIVLADGLVDLNTAGEAPLADLARYLSELASMPDARDEIAAALLAGRGSHASVLALGDLATTLGLPRERFLSAATVLTVASGRSAPDLARSPEALLREVAGIPPEALETLLAERRTRGPRALADYAYPGSDELPATAPRGPVWHIAVAARSSAQVAVARLWVVYLPLPETRPVAPYFVLESWPLYPEDDLFLALDAPMPEEDDRR